MSENIITIRTGESCSRCHNLMSVMRGSNIPFREIKLGESPDEVERLKGKYGMVMLPVVSYGDDEFDGAHMSSILKIVKTLKNSLKEKVAV